MSTRTDVSQEVIKPKSKKSAKDDEAFFALLKEASRGDRAALNSLCEQIVKGVLFRATHLLGNPTDAEDLTQEVLIRVCERISDLRDFRAFRAWLAKIISNEANRYYAKYPKSGAPLNIEDYVDQLYEERAYFFPSESAESAEARKAVMDAIATLSFRQREAVMLHYFDGLSMTEIAKVMGVSKQSVSEYLALSRNKLRKELDK